MATAAILYLLQIADATVDAHLLNFDVEDDLAGTLKLQPSWAQGSNNLTTGYQAPSVGLSLTYRFR